MSEDSSGATTGQAPEVSEPWLADCIARLRAGEAGALESMCAERPALAGFLRRQVGILRHLGLLEADRTAAPRRLGNYRLVERLGAGGMGVVHAARDETLGRDVAVKILRAEWSDSPDVLARFQREGLTLAKLAHPGIVPILHSGVADGVAYLVMPRLRGASLASVLDRLAGRSPGSLRGDDLLAMVDGGGAAADGTPRPFAGRGYVEAVLELGIQAAAALAHAHAQGVVHRDVKPSNLFLEPDGRLVLLDFGLAVEVDRSAVTRTGTVAGSLPYLAPELVKGLARPNVRTDVYGLGVVLYELLALARPFVGSDDLHLGQQIVRAELRPLRDLNSAVAVDVETVVAKAMEPDPAQRYPDCAALSADLRALREFRPIAAARPGFVLRTRRLLQRRPALATGVTVGALAMVFMLWLLSSQAATAAAVIQRGSDLQLAEELLTEAARLWPAVPSRIGGEFGIDRWQDAARELLAREPMHREALAAVRSRGRRAGGDEPPANEDERRARLERERVQRVLDEALSRQMPGFREWAAELRVELARLDDALQENLGWRFGDEADARQHQRLARLSSALRALAVQVPQMAARRELAWTIGTRLAQDADAWSQVAAELRADPRFTGLQLAPQIGLTPLGRDPATGLQEFAHLASGVPAVRDPATGRLVLDDAMGIVLVLVPGGTFVPDPSLASGIAVELEPFFLGKHEVTQGQWLRQTGRNPASHKAGYANFPVDELTTLRHPVDPVSKVMAEEVLLQWGLLLPTSAQWEHAARAGTSGARWTGADLESLSGRENLLDVVALAKLPASRFVGCISTHVDRHVGPAPVGCYEPNRFGLHDVLGNASELTADVVVDWRDARPRSGDGRSWRDDDAGLRGGSFHAEPRYVDVAKLRSEVANHTAGGFRVARRIDR